jgi:hypothetical protein
MGKKEIIIGAFLMALSAVFFVLTFDFPEQTLAFSPKIFPRFVSACLFLMSLLLVIQAVKALRKTKQEPKPTSEKALDKVYLMRLSSGLIIGYAYTQILPLTGYIVATPLFIAGIMLVFNEKKWTKIAANSIVTSGLLYVLFRIIFKVPLPRLSLF